MSNLSSCLCYSMCVTLCEASLSTVPGLRLVRHSGSPSITSACHLDCAMPKGSKDDEAALGEHTNSLDAESCGPELWLKTHRWGGDD